MTDSTIGAGTRSIYAKMEGTQLRSKTTRAVGWLACFVVTVAVCPGSAHAQEAGVEDGEWPTYGGEAGSQQYSPLSAIDRETVDELEMVWEWDTGEKPIPEPRLPVPGEEVRPGNFENTPLVFQDTMIVTTPYNRVVALDAATGEEIWEFDPETKEWGQPPNGTGFVHRGVVTWSSADERRIFLNTRWRLMAIDAATGELIRSFGDDGVVDLTENLMWETNRLHYTQTSPPVVYGDLVILGNGVWDGFVYPQDPPGNLQAFNVRTGELAWKFNLIPQEGEVGNETWGEESWKYTGHVNAWAPMSLDRERGYLYVPVGTASNDWWGGARPGDNLFAESLLCIDAATGERVWHFQITHHGLWDYDPASAPTLATVQRNGDSVDVVAQPTKNGFLFVFNRETGEPIWPIEERKVPASDVPGEHASQTQPFPTKPEPFARQGFSEEDVIDFTPELKEKALKFLSKYRMGPMYTPPSMEGTLILPGIVGGANWGGAAVDPTTGHLYVKSSNSASRLMIVESDSSRAEAPYFIAIDSMSIRLPSGLPVTKPPYGTLTAYDLNTGEKVFQVPAGARPQLRLHPELQGVDLPDRLGRSGAPGPIVTGGGLVFLTAGGPNLYAFDKKTGEEVWSASLDAPAYANPMTYTASNGRQYIAIANGAGSNAKLTVFALPDEGANRTSGDTGR